MDREPVIVSFFSARAGIGRTMAVLNTAYQLAKSGRHVLTLDLDLEKPDLSQYLGRNQETQSLGDGDVLNLMSWACSALRSRGNQTNLLHGAPELHTFLSTPQAKKLQNVAPDVGEMGSLHFLAGDTRRSFETRLKSLPLGAMGLNDRNEVFGLLREYLKTRTLTAGPDYWGDARRPYDYILVDCPHGNTVENTPYIETLADRIVICTDLNDQLAKETRKFLGTLGIQRKWEAGDDRWDDFDLGVGREMPPRLGPRPAIVVATPTPAAELESRNQRIGRIYWTLGPVAVKLSYHPLMVCNEAIFVRDFAEEYLAKDYEKLGDAVMALVGDHPAQQARQCLSVWEDSPDSPAAASMAMRLRPADDALGESLLRVTRHDFQPQSEEEYRQADFVLRMLGESDYATIGDLLQWAKLLSSWASLSADPSLAHLRRQQGVSILERLLASQELDDSVRGDVLFERAVLLLAAGSEEDSIFGFTEVIELAGVLPDRRAAAFVNRGSVRDDLGDADGAMEDYASAIALDGVSVKMRAMALLNRSLLHDDAGRPDDATADWNALIELPGLSPQIEGQVLYNRGIARKDAGRHEEGIEDWNRIIDAPDRYGTHLAARARIARGAVRRTLSEFELAVEDFTAIIDAEGVELEFVAEALEKRARAYSEADNKVAAAADLALLESMGVGGGAAASAALEQGSALLGEGDPAEAVAALSAAVDNADTAGLLADALFMRGIANKDLGQFELAVADWSRLIGLEDAADDLAARARVARGILHSALGREQDARDDFTFVIEMENAPPECRADALFNRGLVNNDMSDTATAIIDFRAAMEIGDASTELRARACYARAVAERNSNNLDQALEHLAELLGMDDCPSALALKARITRAAIEGARGNHDAALADFTSVADDGTAPVNRRVSAYGGIARLLIGKTEYAAAAASCRSALELMPDVSWIYTVLGVALFHENDGKGAEAAWLKAVECSSSDRAKAAVIEEVRTLDNVSDGLVASLETAAAG